MSNAYPILMSAPMVRALLAGTKTQTRRSMKPQPEPGERIEFLSNIVGRRPSFCFTRMLSSNVREISCPYGAPGDLLWVRETWADTNGESGPMISYRAGGERFCTDDAYPVEYERYPGCSFTMWHTDLRNGAEGHRWRSPIHMPRWASRLTLRITDVRVERVQSISEADALAEGIVKVGDRWEAKGICATPVSAVDAYRCLWEYINGEGSWASNPWVYAISFEVIDRNLGEVLRG